MFDIGSVKQDPVTMGQMHQLTEETDINQMPLRATIKSNFLNEAAMDAERIPREIGGAMRPTLQRPTVGSVKSMPSGGWEDSCR